MGLVTAPMFTKVVHHPHLGSPWIMPGLPPFCAGAQFRRLNHMDVHQAVLDAERILPGQVASGGQVDPRWQAIIRVGQFIDSDPDVVWRFIARWGCHEDDDLRMAIATGLLEHRLERHFDAFFPAVEKLVIHDRCFADTFASCWQFGQSESAVNRQRFVALQRQARSLAGRS